MSLTLTKQQELERRLESLKTEQRLASHELAKNPGNNDALNKLLEVQAAIKATEQALGVVASAVEAFNEATARSDRKKFLVEATSAHQKVMDAISARQQAAAAADAAIDALVVALDQLREASEPGRAAFDQWRAGVRSSTPGVMGDDPWELGLGYTHPDLHWFSHVLAQRLDFALRTRIKTHPYILFNYSETKVRTLAAYNAMALATFASVSGAAHDRLQKAAGDA